MEIFELVKSSSSEDLKADDFIYNSILDICLKYNQIELMEKLFQLMRQENIPPTIVFYSIMNKGYGNIFELDKALILLTELSTNNIKLNDIIYG